MHKSVLIKLFRALRGSWEWYILIAADVVLFKGSEQIRAVEEELHLSILLSLFLVSWLCIFIQHASLRLCDRLLATLLKQFKILSAFIPNFGPVVLHSLGHLLELPIVIVHGVVAALVCIPDF